MMRPPRGKGGGGARVSTNEDPLFSSVGRGAAPAPSASSSGRAAAYLQLQFRHSLFNPLPLPCQSSAPAVWSEQGQIDEKEEAALGAGVFAA